MLEISKGRSSTIAQYFDNKFADKKNDQQYFDIKNSIKSSLPTYEWLKFVFCRSSNQFFFQ